MSARGEYELLEKIINIGDTFTFADDIINS
jgi:hypothetical protein